MPAVPEQEGFWERVRVGWQGLFLRPAWSAFAVALLCVGSWGVYQTTQPSEHGSTQRSWHSQSSLPGQRLFGGTLAKSSTQNPFQGTSTASERLGHVTEQLGTWQRKRWLHSSRFYRGTQGNNSSWRARRIGKGI